MKKFSDIEIINFENKKMLQLSFEDLKSYCEYEEQTYYLF